MHKTYCFDLFDRSQKRIFPLCTMDARLSAGGFDYVKVTLWILVLTLNRVNQSSEHE